MSAGNSRDRIDFIISWGRDADRRGHSLQTELRPEYCRGNGDEVVDNHLRDGDSGSFKRIAAGKEEHVGDRSGS